MPKTQAKRPRKKSPGEVNRNPNAGRRSKLNPQLQEDIVTMIAAGTSYKDAARANGISEATFHAYRQRGEFAEQESERRKTTTVKILRAECKQRGLPTTGRKADLVARLDEDEAPYAEFVEAIKKAEAQRKFTWLGKIHTAADDDWKAAAWLLERIYGTEYARRSINELVGKDDGPIEHADRTEDVRATMLEHFEQITKRKANIALVPEQNGSDEEKAAG